MHDDVGLTPMQIIVALTKYPSELVQKQDTLGTVEAGKLADLLIVSADPLQDVSHRPHGRRLAGTALLRQDRDRRRHLMADYSLAPSA